MLIYVSFTPLSSAEGEEGFAFSLPFSEISQAAPTLETFALCKLREKHFLSCSASREDRKKKFIIEIHKKMHSTPLHMSKRVSLLIKLSRKLIIDDSIKQTHPAEACETVTLWCSRVVLVADERALAFHLNATCSENRLEARHDDESLICFLSRRCNFQFIRFNR